MEESGLSVFKDCAFVLVAGGLGERLGYSGIKVSLPTETTTGQQYMQLYIEQILARQAASNAMHGTDTKVPLAIMTSDDTHSRTEDLLRENANFGMEEGQVRIIKQEKVASLIDNEAHMAMNGEDPYVIETKPHGHGDVHALLLQSGLADQWVAEGRRYVVFFQDTNALCFAVSVAAIGVSVAHGYHVNSITTPRKAKDAVGAITRLVRADGSSITCNVEYNQLEPMLLASGFPEGDVNDETGFSPFPGNINQLVMSLPEYTATLKTTGGLVPEFVNPKYKDDTRTTFKKPTRLECMMQDLPRLLTGDAPVGFTQFAEWTYVPVKNSLDEGLKKAAAGVPMRSACDGELDFYETFAMQMRLAGCTVEEPAEWVCPSPAGDLKLQRGASIVLSPAFMPSFTAMRARFPSPASVKISRRSTLIVDGADVTIESLELDGALVIRAAPGAKVVIRGLAVTNAGHDFVPLGDDFASSPEILQIRAFRHVVNEERVIEVAEAGETVVSE